MHWSIAWASDFELGNLLVDNKSKIRQLIVGIDFYQTDPRFLKKIAHLKAAKVARKVGKGTFHPKVYYFEIGSAAVAIVGSANFTALGTSRNSEVSLFLEGQAADIEMRSIKETVSQFWAQGDELTPAFLRSYELQCEANRKHSKALERPLRDIAPRPGAEHSDLLIWDWDKYLSKVYASKYHNLPKRLDMLKKARTLFASKDAFSQFEYDERKAIGGTFGEREPPSGDVANFDWGWFGSMFGAGDFKNRLKVNDPHLSRALEAIPISGEVTHEDYREFIREFRAAFRQSTRMGGVPVASRLLSMKRPDLFICVNNKNRDGLAGDLGFAKSTISLDSYWDAVAFPITNATWYQVRRPSGEAGRIWDGRAAMLDAIYYVP